MLVYSVQGQDGFRTVIFKPATSSLAEPVSLSGEQTLELLWADHAPLRDFPVIRVPKNLEFPRGADTLPSTFCTWALLDEHTILKIPVGGVTQVRLEVHGGGTYWTSSWIERQSVIAMPKLEPGEAPVACSKL